MKEPKKSLKSVVESIAQKEGIPVVAPPLPVEAPPAPVVDKPLDVEALEKAVVKLNAYAAQRGVDRLDLADKHERDLLDYLLKAEEAYFQSLKNRVVALIREATRIA